jgi:hypothetical protein
MASTAAAQDRHIPLIEITTADGNDVVTREWHTATRVKVVMPDGTTSLDEHQTAVKAHGNSSFNKPKKPLTLRFDRDVSLLGMPPNRKWFLVSNFMDHSLLRNALALTIARQTSLGWTSDWRLVDVSENGKLQGCYLMGEEIHVGRQWVDADPDRGFLVELDAYAGDAAHFTTGRRQLPVNIRYPETPTAQQLAAIQNMFAQVEQELYNNGQPLDTLYGRWLDLDSFADYFIVQELCMNAESNGPRSVYMYLGRDGKLHAGPVWDFDLAFVNLDLDAGGDIRPARLRLPNVRHLTIDSLYNDRALWYGRLLQDNTFRRRLVERWTTLRPRFESLVDSLDQWTTAIAPSAVADQAIWGEKDPARFDNYTRFEESADNLRMVFIRRIELLGNLLETLNLKD